LLKIINFKKRTKKKELKKKNFHTSYKKLILSLKYKLLYIPTINTIKTQPGPITKENMFPDNYKDILELRPRYPTMYTPEDNCCDYFCCLVFSPLVAAVWTTCFLGVTGKKLKSCCSKERNNVVNTSIPEPKQDSTKRVIVPAPRGGPAQRDPSFIP